MDVSIINDDESRIELAGSVVILLTRLLRGYAIASWFLVLAKRILLSTHYCMSRTQFVSRNDEQFEER